MNVKKEVKRFINVRKIEKLIIKLIYEIRFCIFNELMTRYEIESTGNQIDKKLRELTIYIKKLLQISFDFLIEIIHFMISMIDELSALSQIN